jgi:DNA-binding IclR family transcriptional regulator
MTRTTPSVQKALRILELLADSPLQSFTLAEICRQLDLSYASAHSLATSLEADGYVRRNALDRTYTLGPRLMALGAAARRGYRVVDDAIPEMDRLADDLGVEVHASVTSATELLVVARSGPPPPYGMRVQVEERLPLAPPIGAAFVAWSGPDAIEAYLQRAPVRLPKATRQRVRENLERVRARGYAVAFDTATRRRIGELAETLVEHPSATGRRELEALLRDLAQEDYTPLDMAPGSVYPLISITAPVFGPDESVLLVLGIVGVGESLALERLDVYARRLCETTKAVTSTIGGRAPVG